MVGRPLNEIEVESYDVLPAQLARRVRVVQIPFIPGGYAGMAIGRSVLLARPVKPDGNSALLAHELVHVRQWHELGVIGFSARYLRSFGKNLVADRRWKQAYSNIDAEVEARQLATDWRRRRNRDQRLPKSD